jgi:hypothetical protein
VYEKLKDHPITYGDSDESGPKEKVLTASEDWRANLSFDYILHLNYAGQEQGSHFEIKSAGVDKFLVSGQPFSQLSGILQVDLW